ILHNAVLGKPCMTCMKRLRGFDSETRLRIRHDFPFRFLLRCKTCWIASIPHSFFVGKTGGYYEVKEASAMYHMISYVASCVNRKTKTWSESTKAGIDKSWKAPIRRSTGRGRNGNYCASQFTLFDLNFNRTLMLIVLTKL